MNLNLKWISLGYFLLVAMYVGLSISRHGANLFNPRLVQERASLNYNVFLLSETDAPSSIRTNAQFYRGNLMRWGQEHGELPGKFEPVKILDPINVGIHPAAKATANGNSRYVFVGSDTSWLYAIKKADHSIAWRIYLPGSRRGIHSTAVVSETHVWIADYAGRMFCLNAETGDIVWMRQLGEAVGASPSVIDGHLLVTVENFPVNGYLAKIDMKTGEVVWRSPFFGEQSHSSVAVDLNSHLAFVGANNSKFFAFSLNDGSLVWSAQLSAPLKASPIVYGNRVLAADFLGQVSVFQLQSGSIIKQTNLGAKVMSSPALDDKSQSIYISDFRKMHRLNFDGDVLKSVSHKSRRNKSSPVLLRFRNKNTLVSVCHDSAICLFDPRSLNMTVLHNFGSTISATPYFDGLSLWIPLEEGPLMKLKGL